MAVSSRGLGHQLKRPAGKVPGKHTVGRQAVLVDGWAPGAGLGLCAGLETIYATLSCHLSASTGNSSPLLRGSQGAQLACCVTHSFAHQILKPSADSPCCPGTRATPALHPLFKGTRHCSFLQVPSLPETRLLPPPPLQAEMKLYIFLAIVCYQLCLPENHR